MEISHAVVSRAGLVTVLNYDRKVLIALTTRLKAAQINFDLEKTRSLIQAALEVFFGSMPNCSRRPKIFLLVHHRKFAKLQSVNALF